MQRHEVGGKNRVNRKYPVIHLTQNEADMKSCIRGKIKAGTETEASKTKSRLSSGGVKEPASEYSFINL